MKNNIFVLHKKHISQEIYIISKEQEFEFQYFSEYIDKY